MVLQYGFIKKEIKVVEVERETDSSIWINGRRNAKASSLEIYHDSWSAAKTYLLNSAKRKVASAESRLKACEEDLKRVEAIKDGDGL